MACHRGAWVAAGPDRALWFTEELGNMIGRITTAGVVTHEFPVHAAGPYPSASRLISAAAFTVRPDSVWPRMWRGVGHGELAPRPSARPNIRHSGLPSKPVPPADDAD